MRLVIRAQSLKQDPLSQAIICEFDDRGGTIGRSDSNTMTPGASCVAAAS
jgi:FHA domain-containing protein